MKPSRILVAVIVSVAAALSLCANAGAADVLVGPSFMQHDALRIDQRPHPHHGARAILIERL